MEQDAAFRAGAMFRGHAIVLVAGDVGRSPRMQYHALSLAEELGLAVTLVGYAGESCCEAVLAQPKIRERRVAEPAPPAWLPGLLRKALKLVLLVWRLGRALWAARSRHRASLVLCQTPPALPSLALAWAVARRDGGRCVADWHNLGFTLLEDIARRRGGPRASDSVAIGLYRAFERTSASLLDGHLCVTEALRAWLAGHFGVLAAA
eukprot:CAMPEP_0119294602 /NCGR_PEP_ID=MMETSP1329-20130426/48310_1 /TAXON_ID=114041 /ORGANISM="Genus nov. species nov., Strain RCC1024" /LENGTH=206 /DNA_ID=CAMNT_0007295495 /DNA_START=45 /DNA_END=661 /DNA_ORIENTATION=+